MATKLAVFDLDGTILTGTKTVMPSLAINLWKTGQKRVLGARLFATVGLVVVARKLRLISQERYTLYGTMLAVTYMAAVEPAVLKAVIEETTRKLLLGARPEVVAEIEARRQEGCRCVIVSAVVQPLLERIASRLGCAAVGTRLEVGANGRLTGRLDGLYCSGKGKAVALKAWADRLGEPVDWVGSYAYADTLPDLAVLETVGHAVAVAPEPALRRLAEQRGWQVMNG